MARVPVKILTGLLPNTSTPGVPKSPPYTDICEAI